MFFQLYNNTVLHTILTWKHINATWFNTGKSSPSISSHLFYKITVIKLIVCPIIQLQKSNRPQFSGFLFAEKKKKKKKSINVLYSGPLKSKSLTVHDRDPRPRLASLCFIPCGDPLMSQMNRGHLRTTADFSTLLQCPLVL